MADLFRVREPDMTTFVSCAGSIFDSKAEALVNPCNGVGVSGAGLAKEFAERFPKHQTLYVRECKRGGLGPGQVYASHLRPLIFYLPTKRHWQEPARLDDIAASCRLLGDLLGYMVIRRVAVPMLGCGLGGLRWQDVRPVVIEGLSLAGDTLTVELYEVPA